MSAAGDTPALIGGDAESDPPAKRQRFDRCFSFMEINIEPGKALKDFDPDKLKTEIKKWAKAVVRYARQRFSELVKWKRRSETIRGKDKHGFGPSVIFNLGLISILVEAIDQEFDAEWIQFILKICILCSEKT
ncbi:hypothetical protein NE237_029136 [Protea cynaroides]|uniref:Uncharacterized protein n=1 Tax=Protea cynaroides TaxID=273540 RepID=A0A9Q0GRM4_9MAGN|nr:hypothetical protein NE237_029136 [Protea cynaroides]